MLARSERGSRTIREESQGHQCSEGRTQRLAPGAKTINVFRACLGAQLTICAHKLRNFVLFSMVSFRFVLSRVCVFLYSLGPRKATLVLAWKAVKHDWHILHDTTKNEVPPCRLKSRQPYNREAQEMSMCHP